MFKFANKTSGIALLDVLLVIFIIGMLTLGIVFALSTYTTVFSPDSKLTQQGLSANIFKIVSMPESAHQQIIINLDDKPFETETIDKKILFAFSPDKKIASEWPKGKSGFLVKSYDGAKIEMLGYRYKKINKVEAGSGYQALLDLVVNNEKQIDQNNINYPYLYVWFDRNQNGEVDEGELVSLKDLGITTIDISSMNIINQQVNSSIISRKGIYLRRDGSKGTILEVDLFQDPFYRVFLVPITVPDEIKVIPDLQGTGLVRNLQEAISKSPKLLASVVNYYSNDPLGRNYNMLNDLLFYWARSESMPFCTQLSTLSSERFKLSLSSDLNPDSYQAIKSDMGSLFNSLMVIEQFTGKPQLHLFTKEVLNTATGNIELHLAISLNNAIIARHVAVANSNSTQKIILISSDMLSITNEQQIEINAEYEAIKKNISDKLQKENPNVTTLVKESKKSGHQWIDKSLENQIKTGEYFVRDRKEIDIPRRRKFVECIKPGNIIDQQVRDCADGKISKTW